MEAWEYVNKGLSFDTLGLLDDALREYRKALKLKRQQAGLLVCRAVGVRVKMDDGTQLSPT